MTESGTNPTFRSSEYDWTDWASLLEAFGTHSRLVAARPERTARSWRRQPGAQAWYAVDDGGPGGFWVEWSPGLRRRDGILVQGTLEFNAPVRTALVSAAETRLVEQMSPPYCTPSSGDGQLATFDISEGYVRDYVDEMVSKSLSIIDHARQIQYDTLRYLLRYPPQEACQKTLNR